MIKYEKLKIHDELFKSQQYVELQFIIRCGTMLSLRSHRVHFVVVFLRQHRGQPEVARARYITQKSSQNDLSNK